MYRSLIFSITLIFIAFLASAQIVQSELKTVPLLKTINVQEVSANDLWSTNLRTMPHKPKTGIANIEELKLKSKLRKLNNSALEVPTANKTTGATPTIGKSFRGNDLTSLTPADNTVAISNDGTIVSLNNYSYAVYDSSGNALTNPITWNVFLGNDSVALIRGKFDPRVVYDPHHDRFVLCILHAPVDTFYTSIILAFSQTNDPTQGWRIYNVPGNPLQNGAWTDYPSIGMNEYELFINANLFESAPNYYYKGTYIQQIDLDSAYAGGALEYKTWSGFDPNKHITLNPAPDGQAGATGARFMNFVMMNPGDDSLVYHFLITDTMNAPGVTLLNTQYSVPPYTVCADAYMKGTSTNADSVNNFKDSISTGASWIHTAFLLDSMIHYTFSADVNGRCGVHYGRINLATNSASYVSYSEPGADLAFPAIASLGFDGKDKNTALVYLRVDTTILPEVCVITIDDNMTWSGAQTVKQGDTIVNILSGGVERWGDYSGIARKYNSGTAPEVWLYGCYAGNTDATASNPARKNSYRNWIAQIKSNDFVVGLNNNLKPQQDIQLYPNPARNLYFLVFDLEKASAVQINLYDINGRKIKSLFNGTLPASKNEFSFNRNALANGQYFIQVNVDGALQTKKLVVVE